MIGIEIETRRLYQRMVKTPLALRFFESEIGTWEQMERIDPAGAWKQA